MSDARPGPGSGPGRLRVTDVAADSGSTRWTVDPTTDPPHAVLATDLGPEGPGRRVEVVLYGWRFEFVVEDAARAELRERASGGRAAGQGSGPLEVRAAIPGRVLDVAVVAGDTVSAGQSLLVIEAMKMQNEIRAPRDGTVDRVAAAAGTTVERGDVLVVLR